MVGTGSKRLVPVTPAWMPVAPTPVIIMPVGRVRAAVIVMPVVVTVSVRPSHTEFNPRAFEAESLGLGRARNRESDRADETKGDQDIGYDSHELSPFLSAGLFFGFSSSSCLASLAP